MKTKSKILISSLLVIAVCVSMIVGSTYALFTSQSSVNIAVTSGKVDVVAGIEIVEAYSPDKINYDGSIPEDAVNVATGVNGVYTLANAGTVSKTADGSSVEFKNFTPGDSVTIKMTAKNEGNVTANYHWKVITEAVEGKTISEAKSLVKALDFTFTKGEDAESVEKSSVIGYTSAWDQLVEGASSEFTLKLTLPGENETAEGLAGQLTFVLIAVQGNAIVSGEEVWYSDLVEDEETLASAFESGDQVLVNNAIELTQSYTLSDGAYIDLNNNSVTSKSSSVKVNAGSGDYTIANGTFDSTIVAKSTTQEPCNITLSGVEMSSNNIGWSGIGGAIEAEGKVNINIDNSTVIGEQGFNSAAIYVPLADEISEVSIEVNDSIIKGRNMAIYGFDVTSLVAQNSSFSTNTNVSSAAINLKNIEIKTDVILENCIVEGNKNAAAYFENAGAVRIVNSTFSDLSKRNSSNCCAIQVWSGDSVEIRDCNINDVHDGIYLAGIKENAVIDNCEINCSLFNSSATGGIWVENCNNVTVTNCNIVSEGYGIIVHGASYAPNDPISENVTVSDCEVTSKGSTFHTEYAKNVTVSNCDFTNNDDVDGYILDIEEGSENINISDCEGRGGILGAYVYGDTGANVTLTNVNITVTADDSAVIYMEGNCELTIDGGKYDGAVFCEETTTLVLGSGEFVNTGLTAEEIALYVPETSTLSTEEDGKYIVA